MDQITEIRVGERDVVEANETIFRPLDQIRHMHDTDSMMFLIIGEEGHKGSAVGFLGLEESRIPIDHFLVFVSAQNKF